MPHPNEALFFTVCELAKKKDIAELAFLLANAKVCIDFHYGHNTPIKFLAKEGEYEAVEFLLNHFRACRYEAAKGYAQGGHIMHVNMWLAKDGFPHYQMSTSFADDDN